MKPEKFLKEKTKELFSLADVEQVLIFNKCIEQPYFYYFTQLPFGKLSGGNILLLKKGEKPVVISNKLEADIVRKAGLKVKETASKKALVQFLKAELSKDLLGVNYSELSYNTVKKLRRTLNVKLVDISKHLEKMREIKSREELKLIAKSTKLAETIVESSLSNFQKGITEKQLALTLEIEAKLLGAEPIFAIVACGKNASIPHHLPSDTKIRRGILLIDFGVRYKNYCCDICRTFYVGKPSSKELKLYEIVYETKKLVEEHLREGEKASKLYKSAESFLKKHKLRMIHALGHGLGIQEHDMPQAIAPDSKFILKKNMVFAIEPAVYMASGGIRIEDDYVIKRGKALKLSQASQELLQL